MTPHGGPFRRASRAWPTKAAITLPRDEQVLRLHVYPTLGTKAIGSVTKEQVQTLVNNWKGTAETIRRQASAMAAMFAYAVDTLEVIPKSPARKLHLPDRVAAERHLLTPADVDRLAAAMDEKYRASIWIGAVTGMRWNECYALRVEDIDLAGSTIRVRGGITRAGIGGGTPTPSSGSRKAPPRTIPIGPGLVEVLTAHVADLAPGSLLFPNADGGLMVAQNWRTRYWVPAVKAAGLDDGDKLAGFHDLRRSAVTNLVATTNVKTSMERLGLKSSRVLVEIYARAMDEAGVSAAQAAEDYMMPNGNHTE